MATNRSKQRVAEHPIVDVGFVALIQLMHSALDSSFITAPSLPPLQAMLIIRHEEITYKAVHTSSCTQLLVAVYMLCNSVLHF